MSTTQTIIELDDDFITAEFGITGRDCDVTEFLAKAAGIASNMRNQHEEVLRHRNEGVKHFSHFCSPYHAKENKKNIDGIVATLSAMLSSREPKTKFHVPEFKAVIKDVPFMIDTLSDPYYVKIDSDRYVCMPRNRNGNFIDCDYVGVESIVERLSSAARTISDYLKVEHYTDKTIDNPGDIFSGFIGYCSLLLLCIPKPGDGKIAGYEGIMIKSSI